MMASTAIKPPRCEPEEAVLTVTPVKVGLRNNGWRTLRRKWHGGFSIWSGYRWDWWSPLWLAAPSSCDWMTVALEFQTATTATRYGLKKHPRIEHIRATSLRDLRASPVQGASPQDVRDLNFSRNPINFRPLFYRIERYALKRPEKPVQRHCPSPTVGPRMAVLISTRPHRLSRTRFDTL